ncbi:hypothetical protein L484_006001 [Morus notabilis]|uniref:Retropepsins domain-containing protein n=1 Tax=Morus notabilis TaxID=981085 RepID=W9R428_9ROSA|nr:hypothetical protein L484_006001 [Morus notabilis]
MEVANPDHKRPMYLEVQINDVHVRRVLVDIGSSVDVIPLATLTAAGIPCKRITKVEGQIVGFRNSTEMSIGYIQLDLKAEPICSQTRFYVLDVDVSYHILLGRPWLNKHKLICSTYHQCIKGRLGTKVICILANQTPFDQTETHYADTEFYDDFANRWENDVSKPTNTSMAHWEEIRELSDSDLRNVLEKKRNKKEANTQCIKVTLPDGRTAYRL